MLQGYRGEYLMQEQHNVSRFGGKEFGIFEHLKKTEGLEQKHNRNMVLHQLKQIDKGKIMKGFVDYGKVPKLYLMPLFGIESDPVAGAEALKSGRR